MKISPNTGFDGSNIFRPTLFKIIFFYHLLKFSCIILIIPCFCFSNFLIYPILIVTLYDYYQHKDFRPSGNYSYGRFGIMNIYLCSPILTQFADQLMFDLEEHFSANIRSLTITPIHDLVAYEIRLDTLTSNSTTYSIDHC